MMDVKIDGQWVASFAHVSDVTWSDRHGDGPCGPDLASFTVAVDPSDDSTWLRLGRTCEIYDCGVKVFGGKVSEVGRDFPRSVHAKGWARTVEGESTVTGTRWGRTADNVTYTPADATDVSWFLDASTLDIGVTDDGLYTRVVATYGDSLDVDGNLVTATVTVDDATAQGLYGIITYQMDLTSLGVISSGSATTYATDQLAQFTIPQWLSRVVATEQNLFTPGGLPAHLPSVRSNQVVQLFNVPNNLGGLMTELSQRVLIGETEHSSATPGEVSIAPTRLAVRNIADALAAAAKAAKAVA